MLARRNIVDSKDANVHPVAVRYGYIGLMLPRLQPMVPLDQQAKSQLQESDDDML